MGNEGDDLGHGPVAPEPASESDGVSGRQADGIKGEGKKSEDEEDISALREWFELIVRAGFWALILYVFFFQVSVVDGPSMQPNFETNDRLVIDKLTYRFSSIHRFDVIVFQAMDLDVGKDYRENKDYIKRVVGLPGEQVSIKAGKVSIDGKELAENFGEYCKFLRDDGEFTVPPHHYFVMGDNRGNSRDSRSIGLGFVSEHQIRGLARLRFMPLGRFRWFWRGE